MLWSVEEYSEYFLGKPESGMGYQIVGNYKQRRVYIVFNAELLIPYEVLGEIKRYDSYGQLLKKADKITYEIEIQIKKEELKVINVSEFLKFLKSELVNNPAENPSQLLMPDKTRVNEVFKRFSAFQNDRRKTLHGGLFPGTYGSTKNDKTVVPSGLSAVARYALPNPFPALYVFTIIPSEDTEIEYGTVRPAFNQSGGGVEILFTKGTGPNTVTGPKDIPDR